tara:strand:- start:3757 stop:5313 length:1557 start_codon:yes stop_codon:yes gene_type:complete
MKTTNTTIKYLLTATMLLNPGLVLSETVDSTTTVPAEIQTLELPPISQEVLTDEELDAQQDFENLVNQIMIDNPGIGYDDAKQAAMQMMILSVLTEEPESLEAIANEEDVEAVEIVDGNGDEEDASQADQIQSEEQEGDEKAIAAAAEDGSQMGSEVVRGVKEYFTSGEFLEDGSSAYEYVMTNTVAPLLVERVALRGAIDGAKIGKFYTEEGAVVFGTSVTGGTVLSIVAAKAYSKSLGKVLNPAAKKALNWSPIMNAFQTRLDAAAKPLLEQVNPIKEAIARLEGAQPALAQSTTSAEATVVKAQEVLAQAEARAAQVNADLATKTAERSADSLSSAQKGALTRQISALKETLTLATSEVASAKVAVSQAQTAAAESVAALSANQSEIAALVKSASKIDAKIKSPSFRVAATRNIYRFLKGTGKIAAIAGAVTGVGIYVVNTASGAQQFVLATDADNAEDAYAELLEAYMIRAEEIEAEIAAAMSGALTNSISNAQSATNDLFDRALGEFQDDEEN